MPLTTSAAFSVNDGVYHADVTLYVGNRTDLLTYLKTTYGRNFNRTIHRDCLGMCFSIVLKHATLPKVKRTEWVVWTYRFDGSIKDIGTLAHECYHLTSMVMTDRGVEPGELNEAGAYYFEMLLTSCLDMLKKASEAAQ